MKKDCLHSEADNSMVYNDICILFNNMLKLIIAKTNIPTGTPLLTDSLIALSTMSLRWMALGPLLTALHVITTLGLQSMILCARDSAEKPANTT